MLTNRRTSIGLFGVAAALLTTAVVSAPAVGAVGQATAAVSKAPRPLARFYAQRIAWTDCGTPGQSPALQCGTVLVPLDYRKPKGLTIRLKVNRLLTAGPAASALIVNPGGPGDSGLDFARVSGATLLSPANPSVQSNYNIVGFDPRGVGASFPLVCLTPEQLDASPDATPDTKAEIAAAVAASARIRKRCDGLAKGLESNIGTDVVARDLDVIRSALGETALTYYGASYGTYIGQMYAHLFPGRVGRLVLDAVLSPQVDITQWAKAQARAFEEALQAWAADCPNRTSCPVDRSWSAAQTVDWFGGLSADLGFTPIDAGTDREFTQDDLLGLAQEFLSIGPSRQGWAKLDAVAGAAAAGQVDTLVSVRAAYSGNPNIRSANDAINCYDRPTAGTTALATARARAWSRFAPTFGATFAWSPLPCFSWSVRHGRLPFPVAPETTAPVLLIGGTHDPNTPYAWARQVAANFRNGVLVTWTGYGHGAGIRGDACVNDAAARYLVGGDLPAVGTVCPGTAAAPTAPGNGG